MRGRKRARYHVFPFAANEEGAGEESGHKRDAKVDAHALRDLPDADGDDASRKAEPARQHGEERPRVEAVEEDLEDAVEGDQAGDVVRVSLGQFVPHQHHGDAAGDADQNQAAHVGRFAAQEDEREEEHQDGADDPVLRQRESEHAAVAEDFAEFFVADLCQRRKHHDDEADGDGDVGGAALEAVDEDGDVGHEVSQANADGHGEKDPEREEAVEEGEVLALVRSAASALGVRRGGHGYRAFRVRAAAVGWGALCRVTNFAGLQQALLRRARSACMARSCLSQASVWRSSCAAPASGGRRDAVVHPLALAPRLDDPRAAQVGQVAADLGLRLLQNFHEVADAQLLVAHQVEQAQARGISQRLEEALHVEVQWAWRAAVSLPWFTYTP